MRYAAALHGGDRVQTWRTPRALFESLHEEYRFTLDGASSPGNGLLPRSSTARDPIDWRGERVFCNPPWGLIRPFVDMATTAELAVLLVPARVNSRWFHRALAYGATPRFFLGRPQFEGTGNRSPFECLLLVFESSPVAAQEQQQR